jgi:hypothetical protein
MDGAWREAESETFKASTAATEDDLSHCVVVGKHADNDRTSEQVPDVV